MTRRDWILVAVIAAEALGGAAVLARALAQPVPPAADLALVDPLTAEALAPLPAACRTPADWVKLAGAYQAFGYFAESEACYRQASACEPGRADWAFAWAFALERLGLVKEAIAQYERAARVGHGRPAACWYFIGRNHLRLGDARSARQAFEKTEGLSGARYELARLLAREGDRGGALAMLDQLPRGERDTVQPSLLRHRLEVLAGGPDQARTSDRVNRAGGRLVTPFDIEFVRLEEVGSTYLGTARELQAARGLVAAGQPGAAATGLRAALGRHWDAGMADLLAEFELEAGRSDEAVRLLEEAVARVGPTVHTLTRLGAAHYRAGRPDAAAANWSRATSLGFGGEVRHLHYKLATYQEARKDAAAARAHYTKAYFGSGHEAFWEGNLPAAAAELRKALEYRPDLAAAWYYLGETHRLGGQTAPAREAYERCLKIDPDHGRARAGMALLGRRP